MEQAAFITRNKNKLVNSAIIAAALLIAFGAYRSQMRRMESLKATREIELKKNEAFSSIARSQEKAEVYKKILSKKDASSIINTVTSIAKESDVKIISIKPAGEENYPFYVKYPFNLVIGTDSYHTLGKFISKIESYPADLFFVDKAEISPRNRLKGQEEKSKLIINLIISTAAFKN